MYAILSFFAHYNLIKRRDEKLRNNSKQSKGKSIPTHNFTAQTSFPNKKKHHDLAQRICI